MASRRRDAKPKSPWKLELNYRNNLLLLDNNLTATYLAAGVSLKGQKESQIQNSHARMHRQYYTHHLLLKRQTDYAKAVGKAHASWKKLRREGSLKAEGIPVGIIPINIIPHALIRRNGIFTYLDKKIFGI